MIRHRSSFVSPFWSMFSSSSECMMHYSVVSQPFLEREAPITLHSSFSSPSLRYQSTPECPFDLLQQTCQTSRCKHPYLSWFLLLELAYCLSRMSCNQEMSESSWLFERLQSSERLCPIMRVHAHKERKGTDLHQNWTYSIFQSSSLRPSSGVSEETFPPSASFHLNHLYLHYFLLFFPSPSIVHPILPNCTLSGIFLGNSRCQIRFWTLPFLSLIIRQTV